MAVTTDKYQVGNSSTSSQNFVIKTSSDGTLTIARGNLSAELGDILKINADGSVTGPFLGSAQTWQAVTRTSGTTYTNSTNKPIVVNVTASSAPGGLVSATVGGVSVGAMTLANTGSTISFPVPVGGTYVITSNVAFNVAEFR